MQEQEQKDSGTVIDIYAMDGDMQELSGSASRAQRSLRVHIEMGPKLQNGGLQK